MRHVLLSTLTATCLLALAACSDAPPDAASPAAAAPPTAVAPDASPAAAGPVTASDAAIIAANSRAMAEACGVDAAGRETLKASEPESGAAFEAQVASQLPAARSRAEEQARAPEFQQMCEFMQLQLGQ